MSNYLFETPNIGLTDQGIHLLRNRFNYETIEYNSIEKIELLKGKQSKHWILSIIIGIALLAFGIQSCYHIINEYFFQNNYRIFYIEQFALPVLPTIIGVILIISSFKSGLVIKIYHSNKVLRFAIQEIVKQGQLEPFKSFLFTTLRKDQIHILGALD